MSKKQFWPNAYKPDKPIYPALKSTEYKWVEEILHEYDAYIEVSIEDLMTLREVWMEDNKDNINKSDISFSCYAHYDTDRSGEPFSCLRICVRYKCSLTPDEKRSAEMENIRMQDDYTSNFAKYTLQIQDWNETQEELKQQQDADEYMQYQKLKMKFGK